MKGRIRAFKDCINHHRKAYDDNGNGNGIHVFRSACSNSDKYRGTAS
ncbi:hypothetical protein [Natranaerobius trueperi]|nr:hypothetical protein [Natranaerobius trueperi]